METTRMLRVGGISALAVTATQVVGNGLHPPIPPDSAAALETIAGTGLWTFAHLVVSVSYFLFIPFVIGATAAFNERSTLVRIAAPIIIVGAAIGVVQILSHLTVFKFLADQFVAAADPVARENIVLFYDLLWPYSVAVEGAHLLMIYVAAMMFGAAMLEEAVFARWVGWLGIVGGIVASVAFIVAKYVFISELSDIIFGVSLLPLIVWIVAVGITLLRIERPETSGEWSGVSDQESGVNRQGSAASG